MRGLVEGVGGLFARCHLAFGVALPFGLTLARFTFSGGGVVLRHVRKRVRGVFERLLFLLGLFAQSLGLVFEHFPRILGNGEGFLFGDVLVLQCVEVFFQGL